MGMKRFVRDTSTNVEVTFAPHDLEIFLALKCVLNNIQFSTLWFFSLDLRDLRVVQSKYEIKILGAIVLIHRGFNRSSIDTILFFFLRANFNDVLINRWWNNYCFLPNALTCSKVHCLCQCKKVGIFTFLRYCSWRQIRSCILVWIHFCLNLK